MNPLFVRPPHNRAFHSPHRILVALLSLLFLSASWVYAQAQESKPGVVAEIWPLDSQVAESVPRVFEKWRSQLPPANGETMALDHLEIPSRYPESMVRVRGVLIPPQTGGYTIQIQGTDASEFWLGDDATGEWKRVQRDGNPNTGAGRVKLEQGVAKRFEFWTMGTGRVAVQWELALRATKDTPRNVVIEKQSVPVSCMALLTAKPDERQGNGLKDAWKLKWGLDPASGEGPNGPWGDADRDNLPNWQEQLTGSHPGIADAEGHTGLARWEIWRNLPGRFVFDLTRTTDFPRNPDEVRYLNRLEIPVGNGDRYGARIRGLIKAPATGEYTFMVIANDNAELWLGGSKSWKSKKLIARMEQQGGQKWTRGKDAKPLPSEQSSVRIALQKDQSYYFEVLHKQENREDHCSVGWILPGAASPVVIGAESLIAWKPDSGDAGDDGLPDAWQLTTKLQEETVSPANRGSHADPDRDGLSNWDEWKVGTDPLKPDVVETRRRLTSESLIGLPGDRIADLVFDRKFPDKPSQKTLVDNLDFSDEGDNYGCRLRGYLTAPDDGPHIFYISGNDACILYLSDSEDKFAKKVIAQTTRGTAWRSYGQNFSQHSEPIELKKGQRYYIEVLYKRGNVQAPSANQRDHSSVAWKRPGRLQTIIDAEYFSPYKENTRDSGDGDDLPDDWEIAHGLDPTDPNGASGAWHDPDGDLLENFREFQAGLDPQVADVHGAPGFAMWECWENITGNLAVLKSRPEFPLSPSQRTWVTSLEGPEGLGNFYGSRLRAFLVPPVTGDYTFAIAGDNDCELWLSDSDLKYFKNRIAYVQRWTGHRQWKKEPGQISRSIHLEAGKRYFIEVLHKQDTKENHVTAAWKPPGAKDFEVIQGKALAGFAGDPNDMDDDDMLDSWELANGSPVNIRNGDQDIDGDGLTNRDEFRLGTRANLADTDGDGVNDNDEFHLYRSDPLHNDIPAPVKLADIPLATFQTKPGTWLQTADGTLRSNARRGAIDFTFNVGKPGVYMVELQAAARSSISYAPPIPIITSVDGVEIGRADVVAAGSRLRWLTSSLSAGSHIVTIDNRNVRSGLSLEITSLTLYQHEGADADSNGNPDWLDKLLLTDDHFIVPGGGSRTSPLCVEGSARFPEEVRISCPAGEIETHQGLAGHWFANVPLDPNGETKITASFEKGLLHEEHSARWIATNLFAAPPTIRVRLGDSLKLIAVPLGPNGPALTAKFSRDGEAIGEVSGSNALIVAFDKPGTFTLAASAPVGQESLTASIQVEVLRADFGPGFSLASGSPRDWDLPKIPHSLVLDTDPELSLVEVERQPEQSRRLTASYPEGKSGFPRVLARLWEDGPIVAATNVNAFCFASASMTGNSQLIDIMPDGTRVVEVRYVLDGAIPPNLSIWLRFLVTDAIFANGDTSYELTAADFDANGEARILMYKAPGNGVPYICHRISPYENDQFED